MKRIDKFVQELFTIFLVCLLLTSVALFFLSGCGEDIVIKLPAPTTTVSSSTTTQWIPPTTTIPASTTTWPYPTTTNPPATFPPITTTTSPTAIGPGYCKLGFDEIFPVSWPAGGQVRPYTNGFKDQIIAFKIRIPYTFNPPLNTSHLGFFSMAEVPGTPTTPRELTVSKIPCDFKSGEYIFNGLGPAATSPSLNYTINNPNFRIVGADFNLQSGDEIYVNVRNSNNGVLACEYSACDMLFDFATPNRY